MLRCLPLLLLLLLSCATGGQAGRDAELTLRITSQNWYVDAVVLYCGGVRVAYVTGVEMGAAIRRRVPVTGCSDLSVMALGFDGSAYTYPLRISVGSGDELCIYLPVFIRHTRVTNCTRRT